MQGFPLLPFERMNEADVREEVLAPIIRILGYRTGTEFNVIREQGLRYSKLYLGRKNPSKDPELRGKADYILEIRDRVRWVLEAKAPCVDIAANDIEQAWSYANHPEVRAVYFVLSNGPVLHIYNTSAGPLVPPILSLKYSELSARFPDLVNILGPISIERDFPDLSGLSSPPLGPGLRSVARISSGVIRYLQANVAGPAIEQMQTFVVDGSVERDENGCLVAYLKTQAPFREMQEFNEKLGFDGFELASDDSSLSIDENTPTVFRYEAVLDLPKDSELLDINTWKKVRLPVALRCHSVAIASGTLRQSVFSGSFATSFDFGAMVPMRFKLNGDFTIRVG